MSRVAVKPGLFTLGGDGAQPQLLGSRCAACQHHAFPAHDGCPYCGAAHSENVALSRRGVVELCTTVLNRPPGYDGPLPYGFGVVALPEGISVVSRIIDPQRAAPGTAVELTLECVHRNDAGDEVMTYAFAAS